MFKYVQLYFPTIGDLQILQLHRLCALELVVFPELEQQSSQFQVNYEQLFFLAMVVDLQIFSCT